MINFLHSAFAVSDLALWSDDECAVLPVDHHGIHPAETLPTVMIASTFSWRTEITDSYGQECFPGVIYLSLMHDLWETVGTCSNIVHNKKPNKERTHKK